MALTCPSTNRLSQNCLRARMFAALVKPPRLTRRPSIRPAHVTGNLYRRTNSRFAQAAEIRHREIPKRQTDVTPARANERRIAITRRAVITYRNAGGSSACERMQLWSLIQNRFANEAIYVETIARDLPFHLARVTNRDTPWRSIFFCKGQKPAIVIVKDRGSGGGGKSAACVGGFH